MKWRVSQFSDSVPMSREAYEKLITPSLDKIVQDIITLSLEKDSSDPVRDIYSVWMELGLAIGKIMKQTREEERR